MIYILATIAIVLTHTVCFAAMTERKYSARKTALIYSLFCVVFVGAAIVIYSLLWEQIDFDRIVTLYYFVTIVISFCVFMYASAPLCQAHIKNFFKIFFVKEAVEFPLDFDVILTVYIYGFNKLFYHLICQFIIFVYTLRFLLCFCEQR